MPKVISVILSDDLRGDGTESSPARRIPQIHTTDGELLMERDEWHQSHQSDVIRNVHSALHDALVQSADYRPSADPLAPDRAQLLTAIVRKALAILEGRA